MRESNACVVIAACLIVLILVFIANAAEQTSEGFTDYHFEFW